MTTFDLEQRLPSCLVSRELLASLENYLLREMPERLGSEAVGEKWEYGLSITDNLGTESLANISGYTPPLFSDSTTVVNLRWSSSWGAPMRLVVAVRFDDRYFLSRLSVTCSALTARETAIGVRDAIFRIIGVHKTNNWVFNPFEVPITGLYAAMIAIVLTFGGGAIIRDRRTYGVALLSVASVAAWVSISAMYLRRYTSFDSRRQRMFDSAWRWFSFGVLGFLVFGTAFPLLRRALLGF